MDVEMGPLDRTGWYIHAGDALPRRRFLRITRLFAALKYCSVTVGNR